MSRLIKERIKQTLVGTVFLLVVFVAVVTVLSLFSNRQVSVGSLKDEVNHSTFEKTERMLSVHTNSMVPMSMNNGPVTGKLDLSGLSFDIKNAK